MKRLLLISACWLTLATSAQNDNKLTLTTMLVVGEAIDNRQGLSELYNKHFTHLFRQGEDPS